MRHCLFGSAPHLHSFESLMFIFSELQHIFLDLSGIYLKFPILSEVVGNKEPQLPARVLNFYLLQFDFSTKYVLYSVYYLFFSAISQQPFKTVYVDFSRVLCGLCGTEFISNFRLFLPNNFFIIKRARSVLTGRGVKWE